MSIFKQAITDEQLADPRVAAATRWVQGLVVAFLVANLVALGINIRFQSDSMIVTDTTWTRTFILIGASLVLLLFARGVSVGSFKSYLYVRLESAILLVTVVVLVSIPGLLPTWFAVQQVVCGVILLAITIVTSASPLRLAFRNRVRGAVKAAAKVEA